MYAGLSDKGDMLSQLLNNPEALAKAIQDGTLGDVVKAAITGKPEDVAKAAEGVAKDTGSVQTASLTGTDAKPGSTDASLTGTDAKPGSTDSTLTSGDKNLLAMADTGGTRGLGSDTSTLGSTDTGSTSTLGSTDTGSTGSTDTGSTGSTDTGSTGSTDTGSGSGD